MMHFEESDGTNKFASEICWSFVFGTTGADPKCLRYFAHKDRHLPTKTWIL